MALIFDLPEEGADLVSVSPAGLLGDIQTPAVLDEAAVGPVGVIKGKGAAALGVPGVLDGDGAGDHGDDASPARVLLPLRREEEEGGGGERRRERKKDEGEGGGRERRTRSRRGRRRRKNCQSPPLKMRSRVSDWKLTLLNGRTLTATLTQSLECTSALALMTRHQPPGGDQHLQT